MRIGETILRRRLPIGAMLVAITVLMAAEAAMVRTGTQFIDLFPRNHPNVALNKNYPGFGGSPTIILMLQVKKGDIFNYDTLTKIRDLTREVDWLPGVNHMEVFSLASFRVVHIQAVPGGLVFKPFMFPGVPQDGEELANLKKLVSAYKGQLGHLIGRDNRSALITAAINDEQLDYGKLFTSLRRIVRQNEDSNNTIYMSGEPVVRGYAYHYLPEIAAVFCAACLVVIAIFYLILGGYTSWWVPLLTGLLSALWGLGFVGLMDYTFDPLMLVVPFILTARDLSHAIQWQRRYYLTANRLEDRHAACVQTANEMFIPGLVAITADITGIVFISFSSIPILNEMARAGTVWLAASLLMVFVFQPILMSYLPLPRRRGERSETFARRVEDLADRIVEIPVTPGLWRQLLLGGAALLMVAGTLAAIYVPVGYNNIGTPLYAADSKVNTDTARIARQFPLDEGWVVITTPPYDDPQSVLSPRVLRLTDQLGSYLMRDPNVRAVISFAGGAAKHLNQVFHGNYPKFFGLPNRIQISGNFWAMFRAGSAPGELEQFFSNTHGADTCIRVLLSDHTDKTLARVERELAAFNQRYIAGDPSLSKVKLHYLGGLAGLYAAANDVLYRTDLINLGLVVGSVFIFCTLLFRSWLAGVLFVFSCLLANFTAFIYMRLAGMALTIDTVPVISLAIGLGVDYAITTVARIQAEAAMGYQLDDAIRLALRSAGESVLCTVLVMIGGLIPWIFSPALFHQRMATLLVVLIATNALAGTLVVPAFISWSRLKFITRHEPSAEGAPDILAGVKLVTN